MKLFFIFLAFYLTSCGSSDTANDYNQPAHVAIDSTNDRLFIIENNGVLHIRNASDRDKVGDNQPFVDDETETTIHDLLPRSPTDLEVIASGTTSRLFITGDQQNSGNTVTNQVLVLDFDGTTLSHAASISPIVLTATTTDLIGDIVIDNTNGNLYATDATNGNLHIFTLADGSENANSPIAIAGQPNKMSLDNNRLYVANSSTTAAEQVITVVQADNLPTTTQIDLSVDTDSDIPTNDIVVATQNGATVMMANQSDTQQVLIRRINNTTYNDIVTSDLNGELTASSGINSSVGQLFLATDTSSNLYGYVSQADGTVALLSLGANADSAFTRTNLDTTMRLLRSGSLYSTSDSQTLFIASHGTGALLYTSVGSETINIDL